MLLATKSTSSAIQYAIKCISKRKMIKDPQLRRFLSQEVSTMAMLDHPNIVKLLKTIEDSEWYFLVMEHCEIGNLYELQSRLPGRCFSLE